MPTSSFLKVHCIRILRHYRKLKCIISPIIVHFSHFSHPWKCSASSQLQILVICCFFDVSQNKYRFLKVHCRILRHCRKLRYSSRITFSFCHFAHPWKVLWISQLQILISCISDASQNKYQDFTNSTSWRH